MQIEQFVWRPAVGWNTRALGAHDSASTLVVAFGDSGLSRDGDALTELVAAYPASHLLVCSTCTPVEGDSMVDGGLSVVVARLSSTALRSAWISTDGGNRSFADGRNLAEQLVGPDLRAVLMLSDGQSVNGSALVAGLVDVLPDDVSLSGGLAGDGAAFTDTWVVADGVARSGAIVAVGLYGSALRVGHGLGGGWTTYGPERIVTRSTDNVLFELDGLSALDVYRDYLGDLAAALPASALRVPLAIRAPGDDTEELVRTILAIDDAAGSMTFAGDVPKGSRAQLMTAVHEELVASAAQAAAAAEPRPRDEPTLALVVSCVGRRILMGEGVEDELAACLEALPSGATQVGFYSHGEIAPGGAGFCALHNQTLTLVTLSEDLA
jgi:hypothetical protein